MKYSHNNWYRKQGQANLPKGKYEYSIDECRNQKVILKIIQGLFFHHNQMFLPIEKIKHVDMCLDEDDVLEVFKISWQCAALTYECKQVFSYKYFFDENRHYWTLLFWDAVMFTVMAETEKVTAEETVPKCDKHLKYAMYITFIPALIATGLIVVPLLLWIEHLELAGKLNPPDWLVMPIVFAIISFFGFIWACLGRLIEMFFNKRYSKNE